MERGSSGDFKKRGMQKGYIGKPRRIIYQKICDSITFEELKVTVNQQLKQRQGWRSEKPLILNGDSH